MCRFLLLVWKMLGAATGWSMYDGYQCAAMLQYVVFTCGVHLAGPGRR